MSRLPIALVTLACMAPSMAVNLDHVIGHNSGLRLFALAATALTSVAMAALIPFTMRASLQGGRRMEAAGLAFMLLACWGFNVANGVGASSASRADATGERTADGDKLALLRGQVDQAEKSRAKLVEASGSQPAAIHEGELAALRQNARWTATKGCAVNATADASREFCADYARREAARSAAAKVEIADAAIADLKKKLLDATTADATQPADPKAESISRGVSILAGLQMDPVAVGVALDWLQALVLELIGSLGPVVAIATLGLDNGAAPLAPSGLVVSAPLVSALAPAGQLSRRARRSPWRRRPMWARRFSQPLALPVVEGVQDAAPAAPDVVTEPRREVVQPPADELAKKPARKKGARKAKKGAQGPGKKGAHEGDAHGREGQMRACAEMAAQGMSQAAIAQELGVSRRTVQRWMEGAQDASKDAAGDAPAGEERPLPGDSVRRSLAGREMAGSARVQYSP